MISLDDFKAGACRAFAIELEQMAEQCRVKHIARARQIAMYLAREEGYSYHAIGAAFERDHSTVIAAYKRADRSRKGKAYRDDIARVKMRVAELQEI